jgi:hypothetical protein
MFVAQLSDIDVFDAFGWSEQRRPPGGHDVESEAHPENNGSRGGALPPNQQREKEIEDAVENCPPARLTELILECADDLRTPSAAIRSAISDGIPPITMTGRAKSSNPPRIISTPVRYVAHVEGDDCFRWPWIIPSAPATSTMRPRIEIPHPPALKGVIMAIRPNTNNSAP